MAEERTRPLTELLRDVDIEEIRGDPTVPIAEVRDDSRKVAPNDLFVALSGLTVDGHDFVPQAAQRGARAVVVEREVEFGGTQVRAKSVVEALGQIAANRFQRPADSLTLVGITGTNGKTTTSFLIESILAAAGKTPGVVGTVSYRLGGEARAAPLTTPSTLVLHELLAEMRNQHCDHAVLEVSSHSLELGRVAGMKLDVGVFTNLTQDHLDFHGTMERYFAAKRRLFERHLDGHAVVWTDTKEGQQIAEEHRGPTLRCSLRDGDVVATSLKATIDGLCATVRVPGNTLEIRSPLVGDYNLANILCGMGVGVALGIELDAIATGIAALRGVPGRLQRVDSDRGFHVFVDYAHSPDALERAMAALRPLTAGRLIVVFGCGGDRDRSKRPLMGAAVGRVADLAIVTSDNPRTEEPQAIIDEILGGMRRHSNALEVDVDRAAAIRLAIGAARSGDTVLIAGKGHEDYQILGRQKIHFDDREQAARAIAELSSEEAS